MGQIFSWFRPPTDSLEAQDEVAEEQSQPKQTASTSASQVAGAKPAAPEVVEDIGAVDVLSATLSNVSPSPADSQATQKKAESKKPAVGSVSKSEAPPADKKARMHKDAGLAAPKPSGDQKTKKEEDTSMSADALSALEDLLPSAEPEPEPPKVQPKDIVTEDKLKSEKGVRVGEREDSLPPEYRFTEDKLKEYPVPKKEPSIDDATALGLLCSDFDAPAAPTAPAAPAAPAPVTKATPTAAAPKVTSTTTPAVQSSAKAKVKAPSVEPTQKTSLDFEDVVTPGVAPVVQAATAQPPAAERQLSEGTASALDALSDTLTDDTPAPAPTPVPAKNIVKEKTAIEEKAVKTGERDDSLPPEYRPSEKDALAKKDVKHVAPKQPSLDDATALGLLSSDFDAPTAPAAPAASALVTKATPTAAAPKVTSTTTPAVQSSEKAKVKAPSVEPTQKATDAVMDALSSTLLPDNPAFKSKAVPTDEKAQATSSSSKSKPKKPKVSDSPAPDDLSAQSHSDVVASPATKKGSKS